MALTERRVAVGSTENFPEGSMHAVRVGEQDILIIHQNGTFYALPDQCTHAKYPLHDGELLEGAVKCQYHGAKFDLKTGRPSLPAVKKIRLFETLVEDGKVFVVYQEV